MYNENNNNDNNVDTSSLNKENRIFDAKYATLKKMAETHCTESKKQSKRKQI